MARASRTRRRGGPVNLDTRIDGPAPAMGVATDLARRSLWLVPAAIVISGIGWGVDGIVSTLFALAIIVANFLLAAWLLAVTGRINATLMAGAALAGFALRMCLIVAAVVLVRNASWAELVPMAFTLVIAHLVLLFWEVRHIAGTPAFPGLKPEADLPNPYLPTEASNDAASASPAPPTVR